MIIHSGSIGRIDDGISEYRYRIIEVQGGSEDNGVMTIFAGEVREFKTPEAAQRCQEKWAKEGRKALLQVGTLNWLDEDEY